MLLEISRRRFLKYSTALMVYGSTKSFAKSEICFIPPPFTTKTSTKNEKKVAYLCNMCRNKCAGFARINEEGIITKLNPNPYFPKSRNMLCPKGNSGIQAVYDPDRIKYPLIRIGKRGSGKYRRVTWDEAYEYIKDKLVKIIEKEKDNRSTIAFCNGEGFEKDEMIRFFGGKLGSANFIDEGSICLNTRLGAYLLTVGTVGEPDVEGSDYVIFAGANRLESLITPESVELARKRRGKVIVLDPRYTVTACKADEWLPVKPGTDLAFVLSMIYIGIKDGLYKKDIVKKHFQDFEEFKKLILDEKYTPKWAENKCHIKANKIEKIAKEFFEAKNPLFYPGRRSVGSRNDFQFRRAMAILNAMAGSLNQKGGIIYGKSLKAPKIEVNEPFYTNTQGRFDLKGIAYGSMKAGSWLNFREQILSDTAPYKVRAMFVRKHNIMQGIPNVNKTKKMLEKMDLVVVLETMPSDTALMADVILPECTYLEREDLVVAFNKLEPSLGLRNQAIKPLYESKSLHDILKGLGKKLSKPLFEVSKKYDKDLQENIKEVGEDRAFKEGGYELDEWYKKSVNERNKDFIVKTYGKKAYESLKTRGIWYPNMDKYHKEIENNYYEYYPEDKKYYSTKSDYSVNCKLPKMKKYGLDEFPRWRDEYDYRVPEGKFRMITGRTVYNTQSATANNEMLREIYKVNHIWINDKVCEKMCISFGDIVEVKSSIGKVYIKALPTNKIAPEIVFFAHGFGINSTEMTYAYHNGVNDNEIIEDRMERSYGDAIMNETNIEIRKI